MIKKSHPVSSNLPEITVNNLKCENKKNLNPFADDFAYHISDNDEKLPKLGIFDEFFKRQKQEKSVDGVMNDLNEKKSEKQGQMTGMNIQQNREDPDDIGGCKKKKFQELTPEQMEILNEEPMTTSNALKAVMGYAPQDDKRYCKFYDPKTKGCFKGVNCKLEHLPILTGTFAWISPRMRTLNKISLIRRLDSR